MADILGNIDISQAQSYMDNANSIRKKIDMNHLSGDDKMLKKQTDAFESLIIKILLDTSMKSEDSLYPKSAGRDIYDSMYREKLSDSISGGIGFSQMMFEYLKRKQDEANHPPRRDVIKQYKL